MNREYDPTKPYNPANKVFVFFLVLLIIVGIMWSTLKDKKFDFENIWNQIVEDFTSEETTTPTNYDYTYDDNTGKLEDIFDHNNELVDLYNFNLDTSTNFENVDLSNQGVTIKATCKNYYNNCYTYALNVEGIETKIYPDIDKINHIYYASNKLIIVSDHPSYKEMRFYTGENFGTYVSAAITTSNNKNISPIMYDNKIYYVYGYSDTSAPDSNGYIYVNYIDLTKDEIVESYLGKYSIEG